MFSRKDQPDQTGLPYTEAQTTAWLSWLARGMQQHGQTVFLIEQLQPSWLANSAQRWLYWLASRSVVGLLIGLALAGTAEVAGDLPGRVAYVLAATLAGLVIGLIDGLGAKRENGRAQKSASWPVWAMSASYALGTGLAAGLIFWLVFGLVLRLGADGWRLGAGAALAYGLLFGLAGKHRDDQGDIQPAESLSWSWAEARKGLLLGLLLAVSAMVVIGLIFAPSNPLEIWLTFGLVYGLLAALGVTLIFGLRGRRVESKSFPNQGTWLSARNAARVGLLLGLGAGLIYGLLYGLLPGLVVGLRAGLLVLLGYGAFDVIKHLTLRLILYLTKRVPWRFSHFLDYAAELGFLQKVGGGYIFIHRFLLEHFAAMEERSESGRATAHAASTTSVSAVETAPTSAKHVLSLPKDRPFDWDQDSPSATGFQPAKSLS